MRLLFSAAGLVIAPFLVCVTEIVAQQAEAERVMVLTRGRFRMVFTRSSSVDTTRVKHVLKVLEQSVLVPGLPKQTLSTVDITISIAERPQGNADAVSFPSERIIVLPSREWLAWDDRKLTRVIRHEIAHIALSRYLQAAPVPMWFDEGFAEWASGGLSCEGETRVRLDLLRLRGNVSFLSLDGLSGSRPTRLQYDYFATFFEFLEARSASLSNGRLLELVHRWGVPRALSAVMGANVSTIESSWRDVIHRRYGGGLQRKGTCKA